MVGYLTQIFWGLLFTIVDVRINGFDILPDLVGHVLVIVGANGLSRVSSDFGMAAKLSILLLLLWLFEQVADGDTLVALNRVSLVLDCIMMWLLLGGFRALAEVGGRGDLAHRAHTSRKAFILLSGLGFLLRLGADRPDDGRTALAFLIGLVVIITLLMILNLVWRVRDMVQRDLA